ncbi:YegP family protein [Pedobacter roseus]|uniref:DUF1508 domain-containing protein n=1 Tax=Pedobacter roseus TaxID=336820 RepID=A0A7G9QP63_9SPHI|nr:DUF1508 domain-containing protein [Pedobacter roseus]
MIGWSENYTTAANSENSIDGIKRNTPRCLIGRSLFIKMRFNYFVKPL